MRLNDVVEFHTVGGPRQFRSVLSRGIGLFIKRPRKHPAHVVPVVVLTLLLRLIAEDPLINPNVAVVPQVRLDDVVQINTRRRPLRQNGRR